jgi:hypothetical protein
MAWSVSTDADYVIATSDAGNSDLSVVLDAMLTAGYAEVSRIGERTYKIVGKDLKLLQGVGNSSAIFFDCSLHLEGQLIELGANLILNVNGLRSSGAFVGYPTISAYLTDFSDTVTRYTQGIGVFRQPPSGSVTINFENPAIRILVPAGTNSSDRGFLFLGNNGAVNAGTIDGLTISTNCPNLGYNQIIGIPNVEQSGLIIRNAPKVELIGNKKVSGAGLYGVGELKNSVADAYLEGGDISTVQALRCQGAYIFNLIQLTPPGGAISAAIGESVAAALTATTGSKLRCWNVVEGAFSGHGSNTASFVLIPATGYQKYVRVLDGSGQFGGGNPLLADNLVNSERIGALTVQATSPSTPSLNVDVQNSGTWNWVCVEYGRLAASGLIELTGSTDDKGLITGALINDSLTLTKAQAEALMGLAYTPSAVGQVTITVSEETSKDDFYCWCQVKKASTANSGVTLGNVDLPLCWFPTPATRPYNSDSGVLSCDLILDAKLTGNRLLVLPGTTTLGTGIDFSDFVATFPNGATVVLTEDANLTGCLFQGTVTVSADDETGPYTLTVATGAGSAISAGTGITIDEPTASITVAGIPNVENAILWFYEVETDTTSYPVLTGGSATITVNPSYTYVLRADAPGYLASRFITISGGTPEYEFSLEDYRALYDQGVNRSADIQFNPTTLEITITDGLSQYSFADVFRTLEDYLATPQGLQYTAHPYPVVLRDRNIIRFPYDSVQNQVNPAKVMPDPGNATDPELLFEVELEGATDTTYDLFDFSQAGGRILRVRSAIAIAQLTVQGDGSFTSSDRAVLGRAVDLLEADEEIAPDRYQKLLAGSSTVLIDKDVAKAGGNVSITEHSP